MPHKLQWIYSIPLIGGVLIFQMGKCVYISDRWFLRWPEFTGDWPLLFSVFWIIFQGFQNCLGLSFNKALNQLYFRPRCSIFQLLCPNAVRNSGVKHVETKAVHFQSVTFGPSLSQLFQCVLMKEVALWKEVCLVCVQYMSCILGAGLENICSLACMAWFSWKTNWVWAVCGKGRQESGVGDKGVPGSALRCGNSEEPPIPLLQTQSRGAWSGTV